MDNTLATCEIFTLPNQNLNCAPPLSMEALGSCTRCRYSTQLQRRWMIQESDFFYMHTLLGERRRKKTQNKSPPLAEERWSPLKNHTGPHCTLRPCMWFTHTHKAFWFWLEKVQARLTWERELNPPPRPRPISSICDLTMYLKNDNLKAYRLSQIPFLTFTYPSTKITGCKAGVRDRNAPGARFASPMCSECKIGQMHIFVWPKKRPKKCFFLNKFLCFFYTVNFVSFACCDSSCLKRQKKGV